MSDSAKLLRILIKMKESGKYSGTDLEEINECIRLAKSQQKKDFIKSFTIAAKYLVDFLQDGF